MRTSVKLAWAEEQDKSSADKKVEEVNIFGPTPAAAYTISNPDQVQNAFRRWRTRILLSTIIGYATFYLVRKNLGIAMPLMEKELGITKSGLGLFLTLHGV